MQTLNLIETLPESCSREVSFDYMLVTIQHLDNKRGIGYCFPTVRNKPDSGDVLVVCKGNMRCLRGEGDVWVLALVFLRVTSKDYNIKLLQLIHVNWDTHWYKYHTVCSRKEI